MSGIYADRGWEGSAGDDRCTWSLYYRGKRVARCFYRASHPHTRHHNGTRWWRASSKGAKDDR